MIWSVCRIVMQFGKHEAFLYAELLFQIKDILSENVHLEQSLCR